MIVLMNNWLARLESKLKDIEIIESLLKLVQMLRILMKFGGRLEM